MMLTVGTWHLSSRYPLAEWISTPSKPAPALHRKSLCICIDTHQLSQRVNARGYCSTPCMTFEHPALRLQDQQCGPLLLAQDATLSVP